MNSFMNFEVLFLTEGLAAAWEGTLIRLCTIVYVHVGLETYLTCECLVATGLWADEKRRSYYGSR